MKFISKLFSLAVISTAFTLVPTISQSKPPAVVQIPKNSTLSCEEAINKVKGDLARRGYFIPWKTNSSRSGIVKPKIWIETNLIEDNYYNYPIERSEAVVFGLSGDSTKLYQGFMSSPRLMATLAAQIMGNCDRVGLVNFSHWWEGYVPVGYFPDSTARTFTWIDISSDSPYQKFIETPEGSRVLYQWGYYFSP